MSAQRTQSDREKHEHEQERSADKQQPRRNPRIVIGSLDYFDMLLEQDEQG